MSGNRVNLQWANRVVRIGKPVALVLLVFQLCTRALAQAPSIYSPLPSNYDSLKACWVAAKLASAGTPVKPKGPLPMVDQQDCINATPICQNVYTQPPPPTGSGAFNDLGANSWCLLEGEKNAAWYTFTVQTPGTFGFEIVTTGPTQIDYDWMLWDITNQNCGSIQSGLQPIRCNYAADPLPTGLNPNQTNPNPISVDAGGNPVSPGLNVVPGQTFMLLVSRFAPNQLGYTINFGLGSAVIFDITPPTLVRAVPICPNPQRTIVLEFSETVDCELKQTAQFSITHPSGGSISPISVECGPDDYRKYVTLRFTSAPSVGGCYSLNINGLIKDKCGNALVVPLTVPVCYPDPQPTKTDPLCFSGLTGTITATTTPAAGSTVVGYSLNNGPLQVSPSFTGLGAGTYVVKARGNDGCEEEATITLVAPPAIVLTKTDGSTFACGLAEGFATYLSGHRRHHHPPNGFYLFVIGCAKPPPASLWFLYGLTCGQLHCYGHGCQWVHPDGQFQHPGGTCRRAEPGLQNGCGLCGRRYRKPIGTSYRWGRCLQLPAKPG
jgi:hypothetical protein